MIELACKCGREFTTHVPYDLRIHSLDRQGEPGHEIKVTKVQL